MGIGWQAPALVDPGPLSEAVHQIDHVEVAPPPFSADDIGGDGYGQMGLAGATNQDNIAPCGQERPTVQRTDQSLADRRPLEVEGINILQQRLLGGLSYRNGSPFWTPTPPLTGVFLHADS